MARALLHKPDFLFLDEATASMDEALEKSMYELLLARLPATAITSIAHNPTLSAYHARTLRLQPAADGEMRLVPA